MANNHSISIRLNQNYLNKIKKIEDKKVFKYSFSKLMNILICEYYNSNFANQNDIIKNSIEKHWNEEEENILEKLDEIFLKSETIMRFIDHYIYQKIKNEREQNRNNF